MIVELMTDVKLVKYMLMTKLLVGYTNLLMLVVARIVLDLISLMKLMPTVMNVIVYLVIIEVLTEFVLNNVTTMVIVSCLLVLMM